MGYFATRSIRFRLTIWYSLALTAGLIVFGLSTWLSMRHDLLSNASRSLAERAQSVQRFIDAELDDPKVNVREELAEFAGGLPEGSFLRVEDEHRVVVFDSAPGFPWSGQLAQGATERQVRWYQHPYLLLSESRSVHGRPWLFMTSTPLDEPDHLLQRLRFFLFALLPMFIGGALVGGSWLSRRALSPVDDLTHAARSISIDNLTQRLSVPQTGDELERLAETWNSMLSRLEQTVGRLSGFAADVSHELRTPLSVIRMTAELATRRTRSPESYRDALVRIMAESERMTKLLDDLLFLARLDSGSLDLPKTSVDLATLVRQVCFDLHPVAEAKNISVHCLEPEKNVEVVANEPAIRRLVFAVLDNAIKYSRNGGEVTVALTRNGKGIKLDVSDSGPGIGQDEVSRIFQRFYRSPQVRETIPEGSGLGLSLAADIAKQHSAELKVTQTSECGSTFSLSF